MKKKEEKEKVKVKSNKPIFIISGLILLVVGLLLFLYFYGLTSVSKNSEEVIFKVNKNESRINIINELKDAGLIKSEFSLYIYVFATNKNLQAGEYKLDKNMKATEIINIISNGQIVDLRKTFNITFIEGKRIKDYVALISEKTNYTEEEIYAVLTDEEYINELIDKYWFITEDVLNKDLYYALEGYLFPSTYEFYENASIKDIFNKMIDQMAKVLDKYKDQLDGTGLTIHQVLSAASIIEREALNKTDREKVSQVIFTRLNMGMALGMDVTTYYAVGKDMTDVLTKVDLATKSPYNTRDINLKGLPVGPICNPSEESIAAVFNPADTDYVYFYADINTGQVYFAKNYSEFSNLIKEYGN